MPLTTWSLLPVMILLGISSCAGAAKPASSRMPVEVWRIGDDGLTLRLSQKLETSIAGSQRFRLGTGHEAGSLSIEIPENLKWHQTPNGIIVEYEVIYSEAGKRLGERTGSCAEDRLSACVGEILAGAAEIAP